MAFLLDDNFSSKNDLNPNLDPGEKLLWSGKPAQGLLFRKMDIFFIPFSLLWGGFAIVWEFMAISMGAPIYFLLFGAPFVIIGLYFILGRFVVDNYLRKHITYGVSDKRIIIKTKQAIKSFGLEDIQTLELVEKSNGKGSIHFKPKEGVVSIQNSSRNSFHPSAGYFELIENARYVYNQIQQLRRL